MRKTEAKSSRYLYRAGLRRGERVANLKHLAGVRPNKVSGVKDIAAPDLAWPASVWPSSILLLDVIKLELGCPRCGEKLSVVIEDRRGSLGRTVLLKAEPDLVNEIRGRAESG
jgi:hypothetical protein